MFHFSTFYTKIPHDKLATVLCKLVDFCFKGGAHQYLSVNKWIAKWAADPDSYSVVYDKTKIKLDIRYLMGNCYFVFGRVFKQDIGIPMGSDPASFFANLFLFYFEDKWEEIYPPERELNKGNERTSNAAFLDLNIETHGVKFATL